MSILLILVYNFVNGIDFLKKGGILIIKIKGGQLAYEKVGG